jgi:hypothetical protein
MVQRLAGGLIPLIVVLLSFFLPAPHLIAQRERQIEPPPAVDYGARFFDQLRTIFGRFRNTDLQRAFESAVPVPCAELISDNGEWREVAFFNEDRRLGDWLHQSLDAVKSDLSVYVFKGLCRSDQSSIQLVTKFPVHDSVDDYNRGNIPLQQVDLNVNAPVVASFDPRSRVYAFDLPYLYAAQSPGTASTVYSLVPEHREDRYDLQVLNHWECKAVRAPDVTFQFVICRTEVLPKDRVLRDRMQPTFGSSAYFVLSDGREVSTTVHLSFGGDDSHPARTVEVLPDAAGTAPTARPWLAVEPSGRFAELNHGELRIRFNPQSWMNRIASTQVLVEGTLTSLAQSRVPVGVDSCLWTSTPSLVPAQILDQDPEKNVRIATILNDRSNLSPTSVTFDWSALDGSRLGRLQCFFSRADSAGAVSFDRWSAIVGVHLALEVRP